MAQLLTDNRIGKAHAFYLVLKLKAGHYRIDKPTSPEAVGEIYKRDNDWYGEITLDGMFFNSCGTGLKDVIYELEHSIVRNGQGKNMVIYQKDAEALTANLLKRLRKG
jgi:hypothetical protein